MRRDLTVSCQALNRYADGPAAQLGEAVGMQRGRRSRVSLGPLVPRAPLHTDTAARTGVSDPDSPRYLVSTLLPAEYPTARRVARGNISDTCWTISWESQVQPVGSWGGGGAAHGGL